jgi:CBS domain-containing protein
MSIANLGFDSWKQILLYIFWINPILALFNLLPAFPMDGGRALRAFLAQTVGISKATRIAVTLGHIFAVIFGLIGLFVMPSVILVIIAFFIYMAASQEERQVNLKQTLKEFKVKDILNEEFISLVPETPLSEVLEISRRTQQHNFPVLADDKLLGILSLQDIISAVHEYGREKKVGEVASREFSTCRLDESLNSVYNKMLNKNVKVLTVMQDKRLRGIITLEDLARVYSLESRESQNKGGLN